MCSYLILTHLLLLLSVAASWEPPLHFAYKQPFFRKVGNEECRVCFDSDYCIPFNPVRCEYYAEINQILASNEEPTKNFDPQFQAEVDLALYDFLEKGQMESEFKECIPFVSQYTNCNKENVCLGCKTCDCDATGRWNCSILKHCRPDVVKPMADHRILAMVLETLKHEDLLENNRLKRSVLLPSAEGYESDEHAANRKLSDWMFSEPTPPIDKLKKKSKKHGVKTYDNPRDIEVRDYEGSKDAKPAAYDSPIMVAAYDNPKEPLVNDYENTKDLLRNTYDNAKEISGFAFENGRVFSGNTYGNAKDQIGHDYDNYKDIKAPTYESVVYDKGETYGRTKDLKGNTNQNFKNLKGNDERDLKEIAYQKAKNLRKITYERKKDTLEPIYENTKDESPNDQRRNVYYRNKEPKGTYENVRDLIGYAIENAKGQIERAYENAKEPTVHLYENVKKYRVPSYKSKKEQVINSYRNTESPKGHMHEISKEHAERTFDITKYHKDTPYVFPKKPIVKSHLGHAYKKPKSNKGREYEKLNDRAHEKNNDRAYEKNNDRAEPIYENAKGVNEKTNTNPYQRILRPKSKIIPRRFEPNNVEPNNVEPNNVEPNNVEPNKVEPNRMYPTKAKAYRTRSESRPENVTKLLKYIVNSLIQDALPGIFKDSDLENNRVKRFLTNETQIKILTPISFQELSEWLNDVHPNEYIEHSTEYSVASNNTIRKKPFPKRKPTTDIPTTEIIDGPMTYSDGSMTYPGYVQYDEVFRNVGVDSNASSRRKGILTSSEVNKTDEVYNNHHKQSNNVLTTARAPGFYDFLTKHNNLARFRVRADFEEIPNDKYAQATEGTEVFVDLLKSVKENPADDNERNESERTSVMDEGSYNVEDFGSLNIMKRDVSSVNKKNNTAVINTTSEHVKNVTSSIKALKDDVLDPLNNMLNDKQREIEDLMKIRNNLITFIARYRDANLNTTDKNAFLSVYKVEISPHHHHEMNTLRTSNTTTLTDKYRAKLKHDVYEVMRDIIAIRKQYRNGSDVPEELKFLIRCMKHYIHKQGFRPKTRRFADNTNTKTIKKSLISFIELVDKKQSPNNVLHSLSNHTKKILKRMIKKNYIDEFSGTGLRIYDPQYNLTNDLANVGYNWQILAAKIEKTSIFDRLYHMKKLHLTLAADIARMKDALALIDFASTRRMVPVDEMGTERVIINLDNNLKSLVKRVTQVFNNKFRYNKPVPVVRNEVTEISENPAKKQKKKQSFLSQIKRLLTNSKKDLIKFLHKNSTKSKIIEKMTQKRIDDTNTQMQANMEKWQNELNVVSLPFRKKRSLIDLNSIGRRIKSIIPKYLRGKVHPAMEKRLKEKKLKNAERKKEQEAERKIQEAERKKELEAEKALEMKKTLNKLQ